LKAKPQPKTKHRKTVSGKRAEIQKKSLPTPFEVQNSTLIFSETKIGAKKTKGLKLNPNLLKMYHCVATQKHINHRNP
jgi:hypothetical protein